MRAHFQARQQPSPKGRGEGATSTGMNRKQRAPVLSDDELTAMLSAERSDALAAVQASKLSEERERALEYYVGDVTMDIPDVDGRSRAVSMDVIPATPCARGASHS
jgi:hypothetical protein